MSQNQAHKNRTSVKHNITSYDPERTKVIRQRLKRQAEGMAYRAERSPKTNPSGSAKYKGIGTTFGEPFFQTEIIEITPLPDARHAARLRGAAARKARGTQSSTNRRTIK